MSTVKAPSPMEAMAEERKNIPFDLRRMTYAMNGGKVRFSALEADAERGLTRGLAGSTRPSSRKSS